MKQQQQQQQPTERPQWPPGPSVVFIVSVLITAGLAIYFIGIPLWVRDFNRVVDYWR